MTAPQLNHTAKVFGYVQTLNGEPSVAADVRIILNPSPQYTNNVLFDRTYLNLLTNEDGYFEYVLPGGAHITVVIPSTKFQVSGVVPLDGEINVLSLDKQY